jgi:hypothetical protein
MKSMLLGPMLLSLFATPCLAESWTCSMNLEAEMSVPIRFTISPPEVTLDLGGG